MKTSVKTKKTAKAAAPEKVSYHRKPSDMTTEKWQAALRKQFATMQHFSIENIGEHPVYSDFNVFNPLTKNTYKVAIRNGFSSPEKLNGDCNFCSCMDFKTNLLGTCKHIEAVLVKLNESDLNRKLLSKPFQQSYTSVYLHYGEKRSVKIRIGTDNSDDFTSWAKKYFDENNCLLPDAYGQIEQLLNEARIINDDFRCYGDALEFIIEQRDKNKRFLLAEKILNEKKYFENLINATLFPYQKEGILFALKAGRCLLADDMGLGKTIQAIASAELMEKEKLISKALVVCPTSLKYQWKTEIERFTGKSVTVIEGNLLKRETLYSDESFYKIISYNVVKSDVEIINSAGFDMVILDEAQRIKNWKTKVAQNVKKIKSTYAIVLTGTPLENKLEELYSILQFVDSFKLGPLYRFLESHQITNETGKIVGYKDLNKIGELLNDVVLRRTKKEVLTQLPERTDKNLFVPMTEKQTDLHNEFAEVVVKLVAKWKQFGFLNEKDRQRLMIALNQMRMICDSTFILDQNLKDRHDTKIEELMNILETFFSSGDEKVVVFSQWERMTRLVAMELDKRKIQYENLHGGVPSSERKKLFENFNKNPESKIFLSTDAGGVGLNLQAASLLINLDIPWNPAVLEQRIARIYRLGQKRNVSIINLVAQGTIEHRMLDVLKFKSALSQGILDNGEDSIFMGESKFKQFMKSVEEITENISAPPVSEEEKEKEEVATIIPVTEEKQEPEIQQASLFDDDVASEPQPTAITNVNQNGHSNGQEKISELVSSGISFLGKLAQTFSDKESSENLIKSIVQKDDSGKTFLKIPVENEKVIENAVNIFAGILKSLAGKQ